MDKINNQERNKLAKEKYVGMIFPTNRSGDLEVVDYISSVNMSVKFLRTGFVRKARLTDILKGEVKDKTQASVLGVGYCDILGCIDYKVTKEYKHWVHMLQRCFDKDQKTKYPSYIGCDVSEDWKSLSKFKEWCSKQTGFDNTDWCLDKDILIKGNKTYSSQTCCFIPQELNKLLLKKESYRGECPVGVHFHKKSNKYTSKVSKFNKNFHLGLFETPEEAFSAYKEAKEGHIKDVANVWKEQIDPRVYEALMNYKVEITD